MESMIESSAPATSDATSIAEMDEDPLEEMDRVALSLSDAEMEALSVEEADSDALLIEDTSVEELSTTELDRL
ncbi:hypothetical protein HBH49_001190 [Parastagonospora nodorum]|nr:hypothetical protein HBH49_001190 [Parastagonospora nodorum]KAH6553604.1 hypothetical protein HBI07_011730 [Parastagonospora nodorum]